MKYYCALLSCTQAGGTMGLSDEEVGRLKSEVETLQDNIEKLEENKRTDTRKYEDLKKDVEGMVRQNIRIEGDTNRIVKDLDEIKSGVKQTGQMSIELTRIGGDVNRLAKDFSELKDSVNKVNSTLTDWTPDIAYVRDMRETKNKIKVNVISKWIIAAATAILWLYTIYGTSGGIGK